jgi:hypothetical protein
MVALDSVESVETLAKSAARPIVRSACWSSSTWACIEWACRRGAGDRAREAGEGAAAAGVRGINFYPDTSGFRRRAGQGLETLNGQLQDALRKLEARVTSPAS